MKNYLTLLALLLSSYVLLAQTDPANPNILIVIADDYGVDYTTGFMSNPVVPVTPTIDGLMSSGLTFTNAWATPQCGPTRAALLTGKYGTKNGVPQGNGPLDDDDISIFQAVENQTGGLYADAVFGKWHLSNDPTHPIDLGADYYKGFQGSSVDDYFNWEMVDSDGNSGTITTYLTEYLTDAASTWINNQTQPWLVWLAHGSAHVPTHVPPAGTYSNPNPTNNKRRTAAMIENIDYELNELFNSMPSAVLDNTVIIYLTDNGSGNAASQAYPNGQAKASLYQGGVHVPIIVSGPGVTRVNEQEDAIVNVLDIYATVLDIVGANLAGGIYNSLSFHHKLSNTGGVSRPYNYVQYENGSYAIRDDQFKLIEFEDGSQSFFDLINDPLETNDLIGVLNVTQQTLIETFLDEAFVKRNGWSCQDFIQNGIEVGIDDCDVACPNSNSLSTNNLGCCDNPSITNYYGEAVFNDVRKISSNNYPVHDFCYNNAGNIPAPSNKYFEMDATPAVAPLITPTTTHTNNPSLFYGVSLDGVLLAPNPAEPFIFANTQTGEFNWDWVLEPTNNQGPGQGNVKLDCASAHSGGQGYHYHGNMFEYAESIALGSSTSNTPPAEPMQIAWAADGFPILYRFGPDASGNLSLLQPSYELRAGNRPGDGIDSPCGPYNGKYTNDYKYVEGLGDLDECNGVQRNITLNTVTGPQTFEYFYVITDDFPQIGRCLVGTVDPTFDNATSPCLKSVHMQEFTLSPGQSVTVGSSTYNTAGIYEDILTNAANCDSIVVTEVIVSSGITLNAKLYLQGAYQNNGIMSTHLQQASLIPAAQPFNEYPWFYAGSEMATAVPTNVTDWVLVEIRDANDDDLIIEQKACFVNSDGDLMDIDGTNGINLSNINSSDQYILIVRSRNHLDLSSANSLVFPLSGAYDFSQSANVFGGTTQLNTSSDGTFTMIAGDINGDGVITVADFNVYVPNSSAVNVYNDSDCNLDKIVTVADYNLYRSNISVIGADIIRY